MPKFLRSVRQARWHRPQWTDEDNSKQADVADDLKTWGNRLSVYMLETPLQLDETVAALAANRETLSNFDYVEIDTDTLQESQLEYDQTQGDTPSADVNQRHYDFVRLTLDKLVEIAHSIPEQEVHRMPRRKVSSLIEEAVRNGRIPEDSLAASLRRAIEQRR